ncbi:hypothetical protein GCM10011612_03530 [Actinomyces gaoshouyii]|uniref:Uncharacterized protein n=1 Tax=Actinomyces gaoshouyii TaxID=1960083 RepID=A0A8H9H7J9_9ACTO|nr:hypothetical protein GCM10011612_03530 [Actinomyces gaoshouyii]
MGGEQRLARIAASLLSGPVVDLSEDVPGLERQMTALVLAAITHANGSYEHSEIQFSEDGTREASRECPCCAPGPITIVSEPTPAGS